jgi:sugar lactone lactonase YvrE
MTDTRKSEAPDRWIGRRRAGALAFICLLLTPGALVYGQLDFPGFVVTPERTKLDVLGGLALDGAGNLYFSDTGLNLIRKIALGTGIVTTVAGSGALGFSGDGGPATAAKLTLGAQFIHSCACGNGHFRSGGLAIDRAGNLYIADTGNHRIREVIAETGAIATVAGNGKAGYSGDGGQATAASLNGPLGIAVDSGGNLYIADSVNHRIRKVAAKTGIIVTVAGRAVSGFAGEGGRAIDAMLGEPRGMAIDSQGNIYFADGLNGRVFRIAADTGTISTIAGNGIPGEGGDGAVATRARLSTPIAVAVDPAGNVYIAEGEGRVGITGAISDPNYHGRLRRVDAATHIITTVPNGDGLGLAFDGAGNLFMSEGNSISRMPAATVAKAAFVKRSRPPVDEAAALRLSTAPGVITSVAGNGMQESDGDGGLATSAAFSTNSVAVAKATGDLYIANGARIRKVAVDTGIITTVAGNGTASFSGDGGPATKAGLSDLTYVALDGAGNLYIADTGSNRIRKVDTKGIISTIAGDGGRSPTSPVAMPQNLAVDALGTIYFTNLGNRVMKVAAGTGVATPMAGIAFSAGYNGDNGPANAAKLNDPGGLAVDAAGNLYIADTGNRRVRKVDAATGIITTVAGGGGGGDGGAATDAAISAKSVAVDSAGNLYITGDGNRRVNAQTGIIRTLRVKELSDDIGDRGTNTVNLPSHSGIAVGPDGSLYLAGAERVYKVAAVTP